MDEHSGLRLLKKGQKGILRCILGRTGLVALLLVVQSLYLLAFFLWFEDYFVATGIHTLIAVGMVLYLLNSRLDPMAKITWLVLILPLPIFGSMLFLFTQSEWGHKTMKHRLTQLRYDNQNALPPCVKELDALEDENPRGAALVRYVAHSGSYPVFQNCRVTYFPLGEDKFAALLEALENAKHYIYLEYFIIEEGVMWGRILDILARKAAQGVDVRVMYDGTCEFSLLPRSYPRQLKKLGIRCKVFAPVMPFVSTHYNFRDHRKILVIDGHTAFNGGINLADEYINAYKKYGHWKDTAIMIQGAAAESFALMFLQLWNLTERTAEALPHFPQPKISAPGYAMPYADNPLDGEKVGKWVYMDLLNRAVRYVHIMTPYLILDNELENALIYAAKRGVKVSILLPGIPDKQIPYALAKTHYPALLDAGVRIYEYTPGFVHAKVFICDDYEAVVGTINLDYRSLYHHFECATYLCGTPCIEDMEADFQACLKKSQKVTRETFKQLPWYQKLIGYVAKLAAPLM